MNTTKEPQKERPPDLDPVAVGTTVLRVSRVSSRILATHEAILLMQDSNADRSQQFREAILKRYEVPYSWRPGGLNE